MASRDGSRYVRSNKNDDGKGKDEDCGKLIEIFQIPSGATKLSLTQSQSSNNLIRKSLKVSGPLKMGGQPFELGFGSNFGIPVTYDPFVTDFPDRPSRMAHSTQAQSGRSLKGAFTLMCILGILSRSPLRAVHF